MRVAWIPRPHLNKFITLNSSLLKIRIHGHVCLLMLLLFLSHKFVGGEGHNLRERSAVTYEYRKALIRVRSLSSGKI